ncbi:hypothetical protein CY34DRAFT_101398, partial [Suillus luteus UH-Slu-Lm8-n1]
MKTASVDQSAPNKPPKLLAGDLTPEAARDWEDACSTYFLHKEIEDKNQVKMIASGMQDRRLHTWYLTQKATLNAGTFEDYMAALKKDWLEAHWETKLRKKVMGSHQNARPFYEWALEVQDQNTLLFGNDAHLDNVQLRNQLEANLCDELHTTVLRAKLAKTLTLKEWIEEVRQLDDKRLEDLATHKKFAEDCHNKSKHTTPSNYTSSSKPSTSRPPTNTSTHRLEALTAAERTLLADNGGCFKCRKFYVPHRSKDCTDGAPDASTYKPLTEADAIAAKAKNDKPKKPVAAVAPVAAVMASSFLEADSDSEDDTCVAPFETAHLTWPCLLTGPSCDSFERIDALIDHGSHLVLINEDVVNKLGLRRRKLRVEIQANSAFLNSSSSTLSFSEYVHLSPSSLDNGWHSRTIRAIIAPKLVVPLLLGGPFLSHNCLIIDHELRTCINKESDYDLLNPPKRVHHVHTPIPSKRDLYRLRKDVMHELQHNKEQLDRLDAEMRRKYEDRFPSDIPHIDNLPTDIVHRIRLKDPNKIIQCRRYNTPRKYREAWE